MDNLHNFSIVLDLGIFCFISEQETQELFFVMKEFLQRNLFFLLDKMIHFILVFFFFEEQEL